MIPLLHVFRLSRGLFVAVVLVLASIPSIAHAHALAPSPRASAAASDEVSAERGDADHQPGWRYGERPLSLDPEPSRLGDDDEDDKDAPTTTLAPWHHTPAPRIFDGARRHAAREIPIARRSLRCRLPRGPPPARE